MSTLATQISEKLSVPSDHIALMFKEKTISNSETPNSIGYIQGLVISMCIKQVILNEVLFLKLNFFKKKSFFRSAYFEYGEK